jgi:superfamily II DNA or RNA helicase
LKSDEQILLVVPTTSLVLQMQSDFIHYDEKYNVIGDKIHIIMSGLEKNTSKQITISTWQSIQSIHIKPVYGSMINYFKRFKAIILDEFHQYGKAKCLIEIAESCINADWRLGATGTTDDWPVHHLVMNGLVGEIYQIIRTKTLIEKGILSPIKIFPYVFKYPERECQLMRQLALAQGDNKKAFQKEIEYIYSHIRRNQAVCRLVSMMKQNTLVLFTRIEHGQYLFNRITELTKGINKVFYIDGSTPAQIREEVRAHCERDSNCIVVASVQVFGVGINIKNLHNIVSAAGSKSKIRVLQAIGRGLRIHESKKRLTVIDIVDNLSVMELNKETGRMHRVDNFSFIHHNARLKYYSKEGFPYEVKEINMEANNGS